MSEPKSGQWDAREACLHGRAQGIGPEPAAKGSPPPLPALPSREDCIQDSRALGIALWSMVKQLYTQEVGLGEEEGGCGWKPLSGDLHSSQDEKP